MSIIYRKDQKYTFAELRAAVKEHSQTKMYHGYTCEKHGNDNFYPECDCKEFIRRESDLGLACAVAEVRTRLRLKINLTGWNTDPQENWTY